MEPVSAWRQAGCRVNTNICVAVKIRRASQQRQAAVPTRFSQKVQQTRTGLLVSAEADIGVCSASAITFVRLLIISDLITGFQQHGQTGAKRRLSACVRTYEAALPERIKFCQPASPGCHRIGWLCSDAIVVYCCAGARGGVGVNQLKCTANCENLMLSR